MSIKKWYQFTRDGECPGVGTWKKDEKRKLNPAVGDVFDRRGDASEVIKTPKRAEKKEGDKKNGRD